MNQKIVKDDSFSPGEKAGMRADVKTDWRGGDAGEGSLVAAICLAEAGRRRK